MFNYIIHSITKTTYQNIENAICDDCDRAQIALIFEDIINDFLDNATTVERPMLTNVSGIPTSGKTTICAKMLKRREYHNTVFVSFDAIMEDQRLPYKTEEAVDTKAAFRRWEIPARIAGYELLKRAVQGRLNILFEHSSSLEEHITLFDQLMGDGYQIHFKYIDIDLNEAKKRAEKRQRYISPEDIERRYNNLQKYLPRYKKICTTFSITTHEE